MFSQWIRPLFATRQKTAAHSLISCGNIYLLMINAFNYHKQNILSTCIYFPKKYYPSENNHYGKVCSKCDTHMLQATCIFLAEWGAMLVLVMRQFYETVQRPCRLDVTFFSLYHIFDLNEILIWKGNPYSQRRLLQFTKWSGFLDISLLIDVHWFIYLASFTSLEETIIDSTDFVLQGWQPVVR